MRREQSQNSMEHVFENPEYDPSLRFILKVKNRFINEPEKYQNFMDLLTAYWRKETDELESISAVGQIFRGHPDLIAGFSNFLPPEYRRILADTIM